MTSHGPTSLALLASSPRQWLVTPHRVVLTERMRDLAVYYDGLPKPSEPVSLVRARPRRRQRVAVLPATRFAITPGMFGAAWAARRAPNNGHAPAGGANRTELVSTEAGT